MRLVTKGWYRLGGYYPGAANCQKQAAILSAAEVGQFQARRKVESVKIQAVLALQTPAPQEQMAHYSKHRHSG